MTRDTTPTENRRYERPNIGDNWAAAWDALVEDLDANALYGDAPHGNTAHSETFAVDGDAQPPETHGNTAHSETFAVDGDAQPPETHGNTAHSEDFVTEKGVSAVDAGIISDGETKITTGFKPALVEITSQVHLAQINSVNSADAKPLGQSHGVATSGAASDQHVVAEGDNSDSVNAHYTAVYEGEVIHLLKTGNAGESLNGESVATVSAFVSDGVELSWSKTGGSGFHLYKAIK